MAGNWSENHLDKKKKTVTCYIKQSFALYTICNFLHCLVLNVKCRISHENGAFSTMKSQKALSLTDKQTQQFYGFHL